MKRIFYAIALATAVVTATFGATKVNNTANARTRNASSQSIKKTVVDPITVSRAEALINVKRLLDTKLFTSNVVDEASGIATNKNFVQYHYRQSGVEWYEVRERVDINGRVGPKRYSKLKLLYAAEQAGKAGQLKQMLSSQTTPSGLTLWDLFNAAMYLREDDQNLMAGLRLAVEGGLCTQEQLDAILQTALD